MIVAGACSLAAPSVAAGAVSPLPVSDYSVRSTCPPPGPGEASCLAQELIPETAEARAHTHPLGMTQSTAIRPDSAAGGDFGFRPQDLHSAYQLPTSAPSPQTIAVVDAYNDLNAEADLGVYDTEFGLPPCTRENGCFRQVNEHGETRNLPFPQSQEALTAAEARCKDEALEKACEEVETAKGWTEEISLDIEVAHATCQSCQMVLVEASSTYYPAFEAAESTAVSQGANEVSNSWGGREPSGNPPAFNHPGVVITASSGDGGYLNWDAENRFESPLFPASSPDVIAVGGTRLKLNGGTWQSETVWNGYGADGGGCSLKFNAQPWQSSVSDWSAVGCGEKRAVADVSADADPYTGVAVYDSQPDEEGKTWRAVGGTSLSSPLIASVFALAGGAHEVSYPAKTLYENEISSPASLHDIVSGSNGECTEPPVEKGASGCSASDEGASCSKHAICLAGPGYDGPTGVGTPDGIGAFQPASEPPVQHQATAQGAASAAVTPTPSAAGTPAPLIPMVSALSLTPRAIAALNRTRPKISLVAFAFTLSAPARLHVTLAKHVRVRGHTRWQMLHVSLTISASRGRNTLRLNGHGTLAPGLYRLTLTPVHGAPRSTVFQIG